MGKDMFGLPAIYDPDLLAELLISMFYGSLLEELLRLMPTSLGFQHQAPYTTFSKLQDTVRQGRRIPVDC